jgi:predicted DNA-binding protein
MGEPPFAPAITGPIDDPRQLRSDVAAELFDEKTRERLKRLAGALRFSAAELIREGTLRYMAELENLDVAEIRKPDRPLNSANGHK